MTKIKITVLLLMGVAMQLHAQQLYEDTEKHKDGRGFRIAGIIGHTLINTEGVDNVFVPSWGLDFEYWFNHTWGIGLHNDIEIETFIIQNADNEEIERVNPLVFTIDALYHFGNGFVVTIGPGVELEKQESFYLMRIGVEYEKDISHSFYLIPNVFLDQRFDGYNTWNIGLGIGFKL
ncbi:hypothetical protein EZY14_002900 [Kordia sp. TARA_039_SRF]|nr:hypothetical protein EZY14_002900 [Kordia sp. TARA_039_SRF]